MGSTRSMWVGLDLCDGLGWVGLNFFLPTMVGWVKKSPQPDPTQPNLYTPLIIFTKQLKVGQCD